MSQSLTVSNTAANDGFSEGLNASFGATTGDATNNGGAVNVLAAGGADASAMAVGIDTGSGWRQDRHSDGELCQSDGAGTSGLAAIGAGSQSVEVSGAVYRLASAQINNAGSFSFGNVHVGDAVSQALSITTTWPATASARRWTQASAAARMRASPPAGSIGLLGAGSTDTTGMVIGVNTAAAGNVSGTATVLFASNGAGTSDLGITSLPSQDVVVSAAVVEGAVFRLADPVINNTQPIAFGNVAPGRDCDRAGAVDH